MITGNKCCFTGYRPDKFPFLLEGESKQAVDFDNMLFETIIELAENGINVFYSGMAMGFDIVAAEIVLELRELRPDLCIELVCAVPFIEQAKSFSVPWKKRYNRIISSADNVVLVSDSYYKGCFFSRNKFMVDNSDVVLTYFDGKKGGTKNTIAYAEKKKRKIVNLAEIY